MATNASKTNHWTSWIPIPSSVQKKVLWYAISHFGIVDTNSLDLEQLDITFGKRSEIILRDVGLQINKITSLLQIPDTIQPTKARILLLRLIVPANLYNDGIVVEVDGVEIQARLTESNSQIGGERTGKSGLSQQTTREEEHLPTAQELAQSFVAGEAPEERERLKAALEAEGAPHLEDDAQSDTSDDESAVGMGTNLSLPGFIATFLKGIVDRLHMSITNVILALDTDLCVDEALPTSLKTVSIGLQIPSVGIEGITTVPMTSNSKEKAPSGFEHDGLKRPNKRCIRLKDLSVTLVGEASLFASPEKPSSMASPISTRASSSMLQTSERSSVVAGPSSPSSNHPLQESRRDLLSKSVSSIRTTGRPEQDGFSSPSLDDSTRSLDRSEPNLGQSVLSEDRYADASDDGREDSEDPEDIYSGSARSSFLRRNIRSPAYQDSYVGDEDEDELPFSMDDSQHSLSQSLEGSSQFTSPSASMHDQRHLAYPSNNMRENEYLESPSASMLLDNVQIDPREYVQQQATRPAGRAQSTNLAATAPLIRRPSQLSSSHLNRLRPFESQPISAPQQHTRPRSRLEVSSIQGSQVLSSPAGSLGSSSSSGSQPRSGGEDLTQSKIFSHEEAESMYMSAMSDLGHGNMPGGWGRDSNSSRGSDPVQASDPIPGAEVPSPDLDDRAGTGLDTPRPSSPNSPSASDSASQSASPASDQASLTHSTLLGVRPPSRTQTPMISKRLLSLDEISLWLPWSGGEQDIVVESVPLQDPSSVDHLAYGDMPGAFSIHASMRAGGNRRSASPGPRFAPNSTVEDSMATLPDQSQLLPSQTNPNVELKVGTVRGQVDLNISRVVFQVVQKVLAAWTGEPVPPMKQERRSGAAIEAAKKSQSLSVTVTEFSMAFLESVPDFTTLSSPSLIGSTQSEPLFRVKIGGVALSAQMDGLLNKSDLTIGSFEFGTPDETILAFENPSRRPSSMGTQNRKVKNDVTMTYTILDRSRGPEIYMKLLPIIMSLNMHKLDDRLSGFGGVSGVLDMSSSIASNSTVLAASPAPRLSGKAVRFDAPPGEPAEDVLSPIKVTARIEGLTFDLQGKACGVLLQSKRLKSVVRKDHAAVSIEEIRVVGPYHTRHQSGLQVAVENTKITFLMKPQEEDLTTLVSLITPSRDKYEDDDDILLDTLLRQRKKGSLIRLDVGNVKVKVDDVENAKQLQLLSYEISKLSNVAKYLPEDDRPGLLTLATIDRIDANAVVNDSFGSLAVTGQHFRTAHVGLPALLALELGGLEVTRNETEDLVGQVLALREEDKLPMIMARIIGDELEPTVKLKLFNLCVEYRVPTLMAILGMSGAETVEDLAADMVSSVTTVRLQTSQGISRQDSGATSVSNKSSVGPFHVDLLLRDCTIGLNPERSFSKGIFLFSNARFKANTAVKESFSVGLELRKASILLIDDIDSWDPTISPALRSRSSTAPSPAVPDFIRQGWQSVATITTTELKVHITDDGKGDSLMNVVLKSGLFLMESCADSTQTLMDVLSGLSPPQPPSRAKRYRTNNSAPITDLMASFTGEPFAQSRSTENVKDDFDMEGIDHIPDDLPMNSKYMNRIFDQGPEPDYAYNFGEDSEYPMGGASQIGAGLQASKASIRTTSSIHTTASRRVNTSKSTSFADTIEETFEHSPTHIHLDVNEDYLSFFNTKSPVRKWNLSASKFENIYEPEIEKCPVRVHISVESIIWHLYDGYDWSRTRDIISRAVEDVEARAEERRRRRETSQPENDDESEIGDLLFQSVWIAIPSNRDEGDLRKQINHEMDADASETMTVTTSAYSRDTARPKHRRRKSRTLKLNRGDTHKITFEMRELLADFVVLGPGFDETQSSMAVRVNDFKIFDHVPTSTWKTFLTYDSDAGERQKQKPMLRLEMLFVKPIQELSTSELLIKVNMMALLLHVDQDALDFMTRFFEFKSEEDGGDEPEKSNDPQPFIQRIEVDSIPVRLHYKPKRIDYSGLRSGHTSEFANFVVLEGSQFTLKHLILYGVNADDLQKSLKGLWEGEVMENQIPAVLGGIAAVKPFYDVGSGVVRDLVMVPMNEYRRDGRIVRSIQKGATAFARNTTTNIARFGARVAIGTQTYLEGAENLLSPTGASRPAVSRRRTADDWDDDDDFSSPPAREEPKAVSNYAGQPLNVMTGFRDAWRSLERDLTTTRDAIIAVGSDIRESTSATGVAEAVARRAPTIILRPAIAGTKAMGIALLGGVNALDQKNSQRIEDKYK
ncbi:autophagy regulatory protein Atg2 [Venturia nashicola]|nr:autophagy regulatory protein Atg2 [Venturia nashicola]